MRNPALWAAVRDRLHTMSVQPKNKSVRAGGRQYNEQDTPYPVVDGMTLQPYNQNSARMTPVGPNVTVHWLGISGPATPLPPGGKLVDETGREYQIQGAQNWGDFWACALQDLGIPVEVQL